VRIQPKTLIRGLALAAPVACAPLAFSPTRVVALNVACAQEDNPALTDDDVGTCCPEPRSLCNPGDGTRANYYYRRAGGCGTT
jgi:hypothetical protein